MTAQQQQQDVIGQHPHSSMTSAEVDLLILSHLIESGYEHTAFSLLHESSLGSSSALTARPSSAAAATTPPAPLISSSRKNSSAGLPTAAAAAASATANDSSTPAQNHQQLLSALPIPAGHLVRILHKGLLYLQAEQKYSSLSSDTTAAAAVPLPTPRLIGYPIPNALPLPPLPRSSIHLPVPPPAIAPAGDAVVDNAAATAGGSTTTTKGKGKASLPSTSASTAATSSSGKRKVRAASASEKEEDNVATAIASGGKRSKTTMGNGNGNGHGSNAMDEDSIMNDATTTSPALVDTAAAPSTAKGSTSSSARTSPSSFRPSTFTSSASTTSALAIAKKKKKSASPSLPSSNNPSSASAAGSRATSTAETKRKEEEEATLASIRERPLLEMGGVLQLDSEDDGVVRLKGHTVPKVQPCSWNPKVPALLATGAGDSTCRIWELPLLVAPLVAAALGSTPPTSSVAVIPSATTTAIPATAATAAAASSTTTTTTTTEGEGPIVKENIVCKHSTGVQRKADVACVQWDPSGSLLATGSEDGIARIWTPSGDLHLVLSMHQQTIFSLKWNSLGTMLLTASLDSTVCLWELSNGKVKQQWQTHTDSVLDVDWNDDNVFASGSMDKTIHLFSINRASPIHRFKGHRDEVNQIAFSPCCTLLASCSDDHTLRIWSLRNIPGLNLPGRSASAEEGRLIDEEAEEGGGGGSGVWVLEGHGNDVHTLAWAPWTRGQTGPRLVASASFDSTAKLWSAEDGTCLHTFARHTDYVYSLSFGGFAAGGSAGMGSGGKGFLATGSNDGKMCVWSAEDYSLLLEYTHSGPIYEIAFQNQKVSSLPSSSSSAVTTMAARISSRIAVCGRTEEVAVVVLPADLGLVTKVIKGRV